MIREIEPNDVPSLFEVRVLTRENALTLVQLEKLGITEASIHHGLQNSLKGWLFQDGDQIVGFALGDKSCGEMTVIALLPEYENQGIGKQLLSRVETWLADMGWNEIWLTTDLDPNYRAYGFYKNQGWEDSKIERGMRYMKKKMDRI